MIRILSNLFHFIWRFIRDPKKVGFIIPSFQAVGTELTAQMPNRSKVSSAASKLRYLEIGPGSGTYTREIVKKLGPQDCLDVVEVDAGFCRRLRAEFGNDSRINIHEKSIFEYYAAPYDFCVSGLPIHLFGPQFIYDSIKKYEELMKPGGKLSYSEYIGGSFLMKWIKPKKQRIEFQAALSLKHQFLRDHKAFAVRVWQNTVPARIHHCQF